VLTHQVAAPLCVKWPHCRQLIVSDVTSSVVWRQIENPTPSTDAYLLQLEEQSCKFYPDPIWTNGDLGFLKAVAPTTRWNRLDFYMRSIPDLTNVLIRYWRWPDASSSCTMWQQFSTWNDVMAAILKLWRQIQNSTQSMRIYVRNISTNFHRDPIWDDGVLGFFEEVAPTRRITTTRRVAMRLVPGRKNGKITFMLLITVLLGIQLTKFACRPNCRLGVFCRLTSVWGLLAFRVRSMTVCIYIIIRVACRRHITCQTLVKSAVRVSDSLTIEGCDKGMRGIAWLPVGLYVYRWLVRQTERSWRCTWQILVLIRKLIGLQVPFRI